MVTTHDRANQEKVAHVTCSYLLMSSTTLRMACLRTLMVKLGRQLNIVYKWYSQLVS